MSTAFKNVAKADNIAVYVGLGILYKIDGVVNLAAQAGVRYSYENPKSYTDSNIIGFINLIEMAKKNKIKKVIFASSSSVYGDEKPFPKSEKS